MTSASPSATPGSGPIGGMSRSQKGPPPFHRRKGEAVGDVPKTTKLHSVNILLSCEDEPNLCYCSRVVQFGTSTKWQDLEYISAKSAGHVLAILEVPHFKSNMVKISVTVACKLDSDSVKDLQLHVPPYELKLQDVVDNLNTPFTSSEDVEDVLAVVAASEKITLTAKWLRAEVTLPEVLVEKLHFVEHEVQFLYNCGKQSPGLVGVLVEVVERTGSDYTINVFSRNVRQAYMFLSAVYASVPPDTVAFLLTDERQLDWGRLREALRSELQLVRGLMPDDAMSSDGDDTIVSSDRYSSFRKQFSLLELHTDLLASGDH